MSANFKEAALIWHDGEFVSWQDAQVHVLSIAVQFGSSVFEGIRCYSTPDGPQFFRLDDHLKRLEQSCRIYRMDLKYSREELAHASGELIKRNQLSACYLRPMVLRGYGAMAMHGEGSPIETYLAAWEWGTYLGEDALQNGIDVCVSSWNRPAPNTFPGMVKGAGHYNNAQLIKMEAMANGYIEAIALKTDGTISEGSGQNLFAVVDGALITNPIDGTNLSGITRDSIIRLANDMGIEVREQVMPRELLYSADELFFTGTASEVTPIRSVDKITVAPDGIGPVTRQIQKRFLGITAGTENDQFGWMTPA